jgi:hypothetical protein
VAIPAGTDIKALTTKMPIFPHYVRGEGLTFDKLTLTTSNAAIRLDVGAFTRQLSWYHERLN